MSQQKEEQSVEDSSSTMASEKEEKQSPKDFMLTMVKDIEKVLSSLADEDALKIFIEAGEGIESSTEAIKKLNLTQKRYYTWLKRLVDVGLIEKRGDAYVLTMLGKFCYKLGESLSTAVSQRDRLELANKLMSSDTLSVKEKEEVLSAISKEKLLGTASLADIIHEVKMITDYDTFIEEAIKLLDNAKKIAYLAAGKVDLRVTDAVFNIYDREVKLFVISTEVGFSENKEILKVLLNPSSIKMVRTLVKSRELNLKVTKNLHYSFVVVDGEYGIIELLHPAVHSFYVAFEFKNALFCEKLIKVFTHLYEEAKEDPRLGFLKKYLRLYK